MKELWYTNKTGGRPFTFGEIVKKLKCWYCFGIGRHYNGVYCVTRSVIHENKGIQIKSFAALHVMVEAINGEYQLEKH